MQYRRYHRVFMRVLLASLLLPTLARSEQTLYVQADAPGSANGGLSWCDAHLFLQDALAVAEAYNNDVDPNNDVNEIRVAQGIYKPDRETANPEGTRNRFATFQLLNGVALRGGYAGCGASDPNERDVSRYGTILSGDLDRNDRSDFINNNENSYQIIIGRQVDRTAILDGFRIVGGNADGPDPQNRGGGLYNDRASLMLVNCLFQGNKAVLGGAINIDGGDMVLANCVFRGNSADFSGGAIRGWQSSMMVHNSLFISNTADAGGAMWHGASFVTLANCTFASNEANYGNSLAFDSCCPQQPSMFVANDSIFWSGGEEFSNLDGSTIVLTFSDVQGGWNNDDCPVAIPVCNIDAEPSFVPGPSGCYYLSQSAAGDVVDSPCIDSGSDTSANLSLDTLTTRGDEGGDLGAVDLGYHYSVTGRDFLMGDYDRDTRIDLSDFAEFQRCFTGQGPGDLPPCCPIFDFGPDGDVDLDDWFELRAVVSGP